MSTEEPAPRRRTYEEVSRRANEQRPPAKENVTAVLRTVVWGFAIPPLGLAIYGGSMSGIIYTFAVAGVLDLLLRAIGEIQR